MENIQLGKPDADIKEIERAAIQADAHNFILALPEVSFAITLSWWGLSIAD